MQGRGEGVGRGGGGGGGVSGTLSLEVSIAAGPWPRCALLCSVVLAACWPARRGITAAAGPAVPLRSESRRAGCSCAENAVLPTKKRKSQQKDLPFVSIIAPSFTVVGLYAILADPWFLI